MEDGRRTLRLGRINRKGMEVAERLAALMAGKNVTLEELSDLTGPDPDKITKEARLRAFLDQVNQARRRLQVGSYGACLSCGETFDDASLDEEPWIAQCPACKKQGAPLRA